MRQFGSGVGLKLALVAVGLVLGMLVVEVGFRVAGPSLPLTLTMGGFQEYHPVYGFFHRPGVSGWIKTDEFTSFVKFNGRGLRGPEVAVPKPPDTFRVLVVGDSVVEGAQVAEDATMTARLRDQLAPLAGGKRVETVNAGVAGFGTGQELLFLEREGLAYEPDLIVLVFTIANDAADNSIAVARRWKLAADRRPFFVADDDGPPQALPFRAPPPEAFAATRAFLREHSILFTTLEQWWIGTTLASAQRSVIPPLDAERELYLNEVDDDWRQAWEITEVLLGQVRAVADRAGVPLLVVASPSVWQAYDDLWPRIVPQVNRSDPRARRRYDVMAPNVRLAQIADRQGLHLLDLTPIFRAQAVAGTPDLMFRKDGHWTELGHAVAARAVAEAVDDDGLASLASTGH